MVNNKQDKPETVRRDYVIYTRQDESFKEIVKREGESISYHVRKALDDYIKTHQSPNPDKLKKIKKIRSNQ